MVTIRPAECNRLGEAEPRVANKVSALPCRAVPQETTHTHQCLQRSRPCGRQAYRRATPGWHGGSLSGRR